MPEVASMNIKGSLDTSDMDRGFLRIRQGFDNVSAKAKSVISDLSQMNIQGIRLASSLTKIGVTGAIALGVLVKGTPAVAASMARMNVTWEKMKRTLGEALAPAFRNTADQLEWFNSKLNQHKDLISKVAEKISLFDVVGIGLVAKYVATIGASLAGTTVSAALLTALGYMAAIAAGGYIGAKVGGFIGEKTYETVGKRFVTSEIGGGITHSLFLFTDLLTGRDDASDFMNVLIEYNKRKDNRRLDLLNMPDAAFG